MIAGMFFGNYKQVKTKHKRDKNKTSIPEKDSGLSTCVGCTGTGCHK